MLKMSDIKRIKDIYENTNPSMRDVAEMTGFSLPTVQKYANADDFTKSSPPDLQQQNFPVLNDFIPFIDEILFRDRSEPRKQRHTAQRIWERLRDEKGFEGSYNSVKEYVRRKKQENSSQSEGFLPLVIPRH